MDDFSVRGKEPKDEVQIYTWKDATLRELTDLVCSSNPSFLSIFFVCLFGL
jgi:histone deacetylase complex subunit SAP18